jgi:hypothetical protein
LLGKTKKREYYGKAFATMVRAFLFSSPLARYLQERRERCQVYIHVASCNIDPKDTAAHAEGSRPCPKDDMMTLRLYVASRTVLLTPNIPSKVQKTLDLKDSQLPKPAMPLASILTLFSVNGYSHDVVCGCAKELVKES